MFYWTNTNQAFSRHLCLIRCDMSEKWVWRMQDHLFYLGTLPFLTHSLIYIALYRYLYPSLSISHFCSQDHKCFDTTVAIVVCCYATCTIRIFHFYFVGSVDRYISDCCCVLFWFFSTGCTNVNVCCVNFKPNYLSNTTMPFTINHTRTHASKQICILFERSM